MIIDGREISSQILGKLKTRVKKLKTENVIPHLYIILLSSDFSSESYIKQKILKGELIGAKITVDRQNQQIDTNKLIEKIEKLNNQKNVHGIIVQRPMPKGLDEEKVAATVSPEKDVDGFNPSSKFSVPVALAIIKLLETIHPNNFNLWLKSQEICVIGKGITAGKPIAYSLLKLGIKPLIVDSKTSNRGDILRNSDIVISAVGKPNVFKSAEVKKGVVAIGVGLHKEDDGKFHGDFNEDKIKDKASFYSPTPGGVGPVNVSMLLKNLVTASETIDSYNKTTNN